MRINIQKLDLILARQCKVARDLRGEGAAPQTLARIRKGADITPRTVGRIAKALGVDAAEIIEQEV